MGNSLIMLWIFNLVNSFNHNDGRSSKKLLPGSSFWCCFCVDYWLLTVWLCWLWKQILQRLQLRLSSEADEASQLSRDRFSPLCCHYGVSSRAGAHVWKGFRLQSFPTVAAAASWSRCLQTRSAWPAGYTMSACNDTIHADATQWHCHNV